MKIGDLLPIMGVLLAITIISLSFLSYNFFISSIDGYVYDKLNTPQNGSYNSQLEERGQGLTYTVRRESSSIITILIRFNFTDNELNSLKSVKFEWVAFLVDQGRIINLTNVEALHIKSDEEAIIISSLKLYPTLLTRIDGKLAISTEDGKIIYKHIEWNGELELVAEHPTYISIVL